MEKPEMFHTENTLIEDAQFSQTTGRDRKPCISLTRWLVTYICKLGLNAMYCIDSKELAKVPQTGPLIAYINHTGMVEAPLLYTHLQPRKKMTAIAKAETWDNWFLNWVFTLWDVIPIRRGEADMVAMRKALEALKKGYILGISPEGTRSREGKLLRAHGGITTLALHSGAPLQAIGHWGGKSFGRNAKRFQRTDLHLRVGPIFTLDPHGERITKDVRQQMADEMMYQLAKLLPEEYRGQYSDVENATEKYIHWVDPPS